MSEAKLSRPAAISGDLSAGDFFRRQVLLRLSRIETGQLTIIDRFGTHVLGSDSEGESLRATVEVRDDGFYREIALNGDLGAAESFIHGDWVCDRPTELVRLFIRNRRALEGLSGGVAAIGQMLRDAVSRLVPNNRRRNRSDISAHYDLGNDLFRLFLDENMMYSSAVFPDWDAGLETAAAFKNDLICRKLDLQSGDELLEIGTGWGGFALHAARHYNVKVTTTTISEQQYALARERVAAAGLEDSITVLNKDYRDLRGSFNKLVSIEMLEAVGYSAYDTYFRHCSELLSDDGLMCLQTITINEQAYLRSRKHVDFIKKYIFPGGCLPSLGTILDSLSRVTDLNVSHISDIGRHYAATLRIWRERFNRAHEQVLASGYDERFVRMWQYYLHYCEAGFMERVIGDAQIVLFKPLCTRADIPGIDLA